jgi:hypothetical protein
MLVELQIGELGSEISSVYAAGVNSWITSKTSTGGPAIWIGGDTPGGSKTSATNVDICAALDINGGTCP